MSVTEWVDEEGHSYLMGAIGSHVWLTSKGQWESPLCSSPWATREEAKSDAVSALRERAQAQIEDAQAVINALDAMEAEGRA